MTTTRRCPPERLVPFLLAHRLHDASPSTGVEARASDGLIPSSEALTEPQIRRRLLCTHRNLSSDERMGRPSDALRRGG
jgi:hypothetical protein